MTTVTITIQLGQLNTTNSGVVAQSFQQIANEAAAAAAHKTNTLPSSASATVSVTN